MIKTRFFGSLVDPRQYRRGFGFRGRWLNFLNRLRVRIELAVARHILFIECKKSGFTIEEIKEALRQSEENPFYIPNFGTKGPAKEARILLRDKMKSLFATTQQKAEHRYGQGRKNSDPPEEFDRPIPFQDGMRVTFAGYERKHDRSARYVQSRRKMQIIVDGEGIEMTAKHDSDLFMEKKDE